MKTKILIGCAALSLLQFAAFASDERNSSVDAKDRQSEISTKTKTAAVKAKWHPPMRQVEKSRDESIVVVTHHSKLPWEPFAPGD